MPDSNVIDWDAPAGPTVRLRDYQRDWIAKTHAARARGLSRLGIDAVGGSGKTTYAGALALEAWNERGGRTLIIENRQQLVRQTAKRFRDETGLEVDIEMGAHRASPFAAVVVACAPSLGRIPRLTGFPDNHFEYVFADEAHNSVAELFLRAMRYFHYGAESLAEGWVAPKDGTYKIKACVIGISATWDSHGSRNLGNFYQEIVARYTYMQALEDGWLVALREFNIPVKIDCRKFRRKMTKNGTDFSEADQTAAIIPVIEELAAQIIQLASSRKTMCFLPSKECVLLMNESLNRRGLKSLAVFGDSLDKTEDTEEFEAHGPGICLCLCAMYVEGTDIPSVDTVAWMRATESPTFYKQGAYRPSRPLPGLVTDKMGAAGRRAAIASSAKPWSMMISPFFISDKISIMEVTDLFVDQSIKNPKVKRPTDLTDLAKIRDYIAALEKAADKHRNKQPRTIDPVRFAVSVGDEALANYLPECAADASPASKEEKDTILAYGLDTTQITCSGQAQRLIRKLLTRDQLGLARPKVIEQLVLRLGWPKSMAESMKAGKAGVLIGRGVHYQRPRESPTACYCNATPNPPCSFCESGAATVRDGT